MEKGRRRSDLPRSFETNPGERWTDSEVKGWRRFRHLFWIHKFYRDVWLISITALVVLALDASNNQVDDIQKSRIEATEKVCGGLNDNALGVNKAFDYINQIIINGAVLPGDEVTQRDSRGYPLKINSGEISRNFQAQGLPPAQERLDNARENASGLDKLKVPLENCEAAVEAVRHPEAVQEGD